MIETIADNLILYFALTVVLFFFGLTVLACAKSASEADKKLDELFNQQAKETEQ